MGRQAPHRRLWNASSLARPLSCGGPSGRSQATHARASKQLYSSDRSEIIWTESDIAQLKKAGGSRKLGGKLTELPCSPELSHAVDLAAHTGLRLSDLLRLSWSHVGEDAITFATGKSRGRREAIIPLYDGLREVLARIPKRATTILTSSKRRPWTANGFGSSFNDAKRAGFNGRQGFALSRPTRDGCDEVLHCGPINSRDR